MAYIPTIRGRRLGREIRKLRETQGLTGPQASELLGWDQAKISRVENAKMRVTVGEVMEVCEVYKVTGDQRAELIQLAREARIQGWWAAYGDVLKQGFTDYLAFEAEATTYRSYEVHLIPGLFQTEEYIRAVFRSSTVLRNAEEIERAVEARMARQSRLISADQPLQVFQILEEGALRGMIGDPETMIGQLKSLIELGQRPNVSLQVVPYRSAAHVALDGPFTLLTFEGYPEVLYVEHFGGCQYYEKAYETGHGNVVFEHLRSSALNTADSATLIRQVAKEFADSP